MDFFEQRDNVVRELKSEARDVMPRDKYQAFNRFLGLQSPRQRSFLSRGLPAVTLP